MSDVAKGHSRKRRSAREFPEEDPDFQIAPMIDVLLVLLVFFMSISSTEVLQSTKGIELPVAVNGRDAAKNAKQMIVNVSWNLIGDAGSISIDDKAYPTPSDIIPLLKARVEVVPEMRVLLRADKQVRYSYLREIMIAIGQAGIGNVTFSVVDKDKT
ncbi:MAG: biopolymer transporter ExbD [Verrucomicrobia bacterium]|nr:biopolymer transporter ExbD [Verrucomicrobiota bacterium]